MKPRASLIALATAAVLLAGCASATPTASSTSPTASSPAPETSSPSPSPTPTVPMQDPDDPRTWIITQDGIGPLLLGEPFDAARGLLPEGATHDPDMCFWSAWWAAPDGVNQLYVVGGASTGAEAVGPVEVVGSTGYEATAIVGPVTAEGVGAGATREEILAVHPDAVEGQGSFGGTFLQIGRIFFSLPGEGEMGSSSVVVSTAAEPPYEICG